MPGFIMVIMAGEKLGCIMDSGIGHNNPIDYKNPGYVFNSRVFFCVKFIFETQ